MKKRGSSHLEVILSFTMFVSFVLFMIVFINPVRGGLLQSSIIEKLGTAFFEDVDVSLIKFPLNSSAGCVKLNVSEFGSVNSFVFDSSGIEFDSGVSGSYLQVNQSSEILWVYLSEVFPSVSFSCSTPVSAETGNFEKLSFVSFEKLGAFESNYSSDYGLLKQELGFPAIRDFSIKCVECNNFYVTQDIPEDVDVFARTFSKQMIYENGTIKNVEFILRVW